MRREIVLDVWGDFACFSRPESRVERLTYPVPTPSAMRGVLSAVYSKPGEFYWQVNKIEVLKKISYVSFKRNEVKNRESEKKPLMVEEERTQRQTVALRDVKYRVHASIVKRREFEGKEEALYQQALRRIRSGKCFFQPSLGLREFAAYFEEGIQEAKPIDLDLDLGYMVYDVFDLHSYAVSAKMNPFVTLFHARLNGGVLEVPDFDSDEVLKPEVV